MGGLTRYVPSLAVLSLVLCGAVEGQQQATPTKVTWADRKAGLIRRQEQQPGSDSVREAVRASRIWSEPSKNSGDGSIKNNGDSNSNNIGGGERLLQGAPLLETLVVPSDEARATSNGHVASSTLRLEQAPPASYPAAPEKNGSEEPQTRLLENEESCELGGAFTVSSTVYRSANGCYFTLAADDPYTFVSSTSLGPAVGDRLLLPSSSLVGADSVSEAFLDVWLMAEVYDILSAGLVLSVECESYELFEEGSHPSDVTIWLCYIGWGYQVVSAETFGITCGCGGTGTETTTTPAPAAAATAPTPVDADSPEGTSGCGGTDPFAIVSAQLPELDGCYRDTGGNDGDTFFSVTGEKVDGVLAVRPAPLDAQAFDLRWIVGIYSLDSETATATCISDEAPSVAHPADSTFYCDLTGTGAYTTVTDDQFAIVCGCDGITAAPSLVPVRGIDFGFPTPSPAASPVDEADAIAPSPSPEGAEEAVTGTTPSPAGGEEAGTAADGTSDGAPVAGVPRAWLSTAMAVLVLVAVVVGMP